VFDSGWLDVVGVHRPRPFLFLAEGVLMYFTEAQVRSLLLTLQERFPGAELVCDAFSSLIVWGNNLRLALAKIGARYRWAMKRGKDLEKWGDGIRLLDEWFFLDRYEPRLASHWWMRHIPLLARASGIYHYQLSAA
jgi:O-methyltransferase involved in polyketide biosynthesis